MIKVLFFASVRDRLGIDQLELPEVPRTVEDLRLQLASRDETWAHVLDAEPSVLVAVNQTMAAADTSLNDGDEVGFFPPVTGG